MVLRTPLVLTDGQIEQLRPTDTLDSGLVQPVTLIELVNGTGGTINKGQPIYNSGGLAFLAKSSTSWSLSLCTALVWDTSIANGVSGLFIIRGVISQSTGSWNSIMSTTWPGLRDGYTHYASTIAGEVHGTKPGTTWTTQVGKALSHTDLFVEIFNPLN